MKTKLNRFFLRNRDKGIPNLMLWIAIANVIVYAMVRISATGSVIYELLCFDGVKILQGQVWRAVTFLFTYLVESGLLGALSLFCYFWFGKLLESVWGSLRFTLFYFTGVLLVDAAGLILAGLYMGGLNVLPVYATSSYLNLSIFLAVATLAPDNMIRIWFVIPIKMKWLAWIDFGFTVYGLVSGIITMCRNLPLVYLGWLLPLVALGNYFLFFGKKVAGLLPDKLRYRRPKQTKEKKQKANPDWAAGYRSSTGQRPYRFRCTVCGRTDTDYPSLEFRFCSRCSGYYCYCMDHINNHTHIVE